MKYSIDGGPVQDASPPRRGVSVIVGRKEDKGMAYVIEMNTRLGYVTKLGRDGFYRVEVLRD